MSIDLFEEVQEFGRPVTLVAFADDEPRGDIKCADLAGKKLLGLDLSGLDLSGVVTLNGADFNGADLASTRLIEPIGLDAAKNFDKAQNIERLLRE